MYNNLKKSVNDDCFSTDFDALGTKKPAPHECMSSVVGIRAFSCYFTTAMERSLFARCIIGMKIHFSDKAPELKKGMGEAEKKEITKKRNVYNEKKTEIELLNCVISLLNSSIIGVDRLDYIIRDAATIGFKNAQVDYMRLLNGMRIVSVEKTLCIGYHKSALSVIESAMSFLTSLFASESDSNPLFCYEALTEKGKNLLLSTQLFSTQAQKLLENGDLWSLKAQILSDKEKLFAEGINVNAKNSMFSRNYPVSLLADEDFLNLMKHFCKEGLGYEYFSRNKRCSAVWKSEAELRALFQQRIGDDTRSIKTLENDFEDVIK